jgi:hypothetical protein
MRRGSENHEENNAQLYRAGWFAVRWNIRGSGEITPQSAESPNACATRFNCPVIEPVERSQELLALLRLLPA